MRRLLGLLVVLGAVSIGTRSADAAASRPLTIEDRVAAQRAIEEVYWRHRLWPKDNPQPKPSLDVVMPESAIRAKVEDYLKKSNALEGWWRRPITGEQLQAELDRVAHGSRDPRMLQELFDALGNDAMLVAETLVRQSLVERLARNWYAQDERFEGPTRRKTEAASPKPSFDTWWKLERAKQSTELARTTGKFSPPALDPVGCTNDTWSPTLTEVPDHRWLHTAVWTGTEMIVWGGAADGYELSSGGRYNPATDTWTPTSTGANVPVARFRHTALWTGTEMIVWGGVSTNQTTGSSERLQSGARYDPATDSWTATSAGANVPTARESHLAVWTGTEMIVWGGFPSPAPLSGGRYHPATDSWTTISAGANAPFAYFPHTAVWTGTEMIVWASLGGRYNPITDSWSPMSTSVNVPFRSSYTAVWTGTELIVWGGYDSGQSLQLNTGGRYNPSSDTWTPTSTGANVPSPREGPTAVWTGSKMIVWGGRGLNDGAAYDPGSDSWVPLASTTLQPRYRHSAIWTGTEMVVWGGEGGAGSMGSNTHNTGGRYNPASDSWVATSTGAAAPVGRFTHTAIWTGAEMIVWGGQTNHQPPTPMWGLNTGGRYTPATDSWVPTSVGPGVPSARTYHSAVWTGTEMIVWGGLGADWLNTGGRYNPVTDSWSATSTGVNVPPTLHQQSTVWTGHEMIVWGVGSGGDGSTATGGRYDPITNTWQPMATGTAVPEQFWSPVVWTGQEMIVWGDGPDPGSRYNPSTDSWAAISTGANAPSFRSAYVNVWTGSEMILWGGAYTTTGGRYNPSTDSWIPTSTGANVPSPRGLASAVWTGTEMLVWGGGNVSTGFPATVGGRYNPTTNSWVPMAIRPNAPSPVPVYHSAVWTGTEMIVWGGYPGTSSGGRYCACPSGRLLYRDADGDGYGDPGVSSASCDGSAPAGYVIDYTDCNDASATRHPNAPETCNGFDDDCNGLVDDSVSGVDSDADAIRDACDNCPFVVNVSQSDFDQDGQGDTCDLNDGLIVEWRDSKTSVSWQAEQGPTSWNVYIGDLDVMKATGVYTQVTGSNPVASRQCGVVATIAGDPVVLSPGKASFSLITGVTGGIEGSLGSSSSGPRSNANPCP